MKSTARIGIGAILFIAFIAITWAISNNGLQAQPLDQPKPPGTAVQSSTPVEAKSSRPVSELPTGTAPQLDREINALKNPGLFQEDLGLTGTDTHKQDGLAALSQLETGTTAPPLFTFEGLGSDGFTPPDTVGEVGPNHYVQMVNVSFAIFDKEGNVLVDDAAFTDLFTGSGLTACASENNGDPIVVYDELADRWLLSQFAVDSGERMCIAISKTPDPTGEFWLYQFDMPDFPDYFKFGVWPDAYYMTTNSGFPNAYYAYAFDRAAMLNGDPATYQFSDGHPNFMMPADLDGATPPQAGTPGYFYTMLSDGYPNHPAGVDRLAFYEFDVDWATPANTTFTMTDEFAITPYNYTVCGFFVGDCIDQPGTAQGLDSLSYWPMFRFGYRNLGSYEALVGNFTVDLDGTDKAAIRWFELQNTGSGWGLYQEGTHAPDSDHRWMGSIAMDGSGNIGLGYSVSSDTTIPEIRYATRLRTDPLGTLQAEETMYASSGVHTGVHRWGDYSALSVDPADDCTFWYTNQYDVADNSGFDWHTRIGTFQIPGCTGSLGPTGTVTGLIDDGATGIAGALASATNISGTINATADANGYYTMTLPVGDYDVAASAYGYLPSSATATTIVSDTTNVIDFTLTAAPSATLDGVVTDAATGWPLYASIDISGGGGYPGTTIWTDPETGAYDITLVTGITYTLNVKAWVDGYTNKSEDVYLTSDATVDIALDANLATCMAPGYTLFNLYLEDFEADNGGFTHGGSQDEWEWGSPSGWPSVCADGSNCWGTDLDSTYENSADNWLESSVITLTGMSGLPAVVNWQQAWAIEDSTWDNAYADITLDGGLSWNEMWSHTGGTTTEEWQELSFAFTVPVTETVQLRWRFTSDSSVIYEGVYIDSIGFSECLSPVDGGLVVGHVFDSGSSAAIDGATVTGLDDSTMTMPTPADAAVDDGFYTLFSLSGSQMFTATMDLFSDAVDSVAVVNGGTVAHDFYLDSSYPIIDPDSLEITLTVGLSATLPLTVTNIGNGALDFQWVEVNGGYTPLNLPVYIAPSITTNTSTNRHYSDGNHVISSSTSKVFDMAPERYAGPTGFVFYGDRPTFDADAPNLPLENFGNTLVSSGDITACPGPFNNATNDSCFAPNSILDGISLASDPTGDMIVIGTNALGNPDVLVGTNTFASDSDITFSSGANAVGLEIWSPNGNATVDLYLYGSGDVLLGQTSVVATASGTFWGVISSDLITHIHSNAPGGDGELFTNIAFGQFSGGVSWLSEDPISSTVASLSSESIDITFDAGVPETTQPGDYEATLELTNNSPVGTIDVPVTMHVVPGLTTAVISGTVSSLGHCDINPAGLDGAEVLIQSSLGEEWTILTDANGHYSHYLDETNAPLTISSSYAEHNTEIETGVPLTGTETTIVDLDLTWLQPCADVAVPQDLDVVLDWGDSTTLPLSLGNAGAASMSFEWSDSETGYIIAAPAAADVLIVAEDSTAAAAMEASLTALGYTYMEVNNTTYTSMPVDDLLAYGAVFYAGIPSSGAEQTQSIAYMDAGGNFFVADNDFGYFANADTIYTEYMQATYGTDSGADGVLTGVDIMAGINPDISSDPYPDDFTVGAEGIEIFEAPSGNSAGVKIDRNGYKAVYLSFDYDEIANDADDLATMEQIVGHLLFTDAPWMWMSILNGTMAQYTPPTDMNLTFNSNYVSAPGTYYGLVKVDTNDPVTPTYTYPVTMTVNPLSPDTGILKGTVTDLGYCDVNPALFTGVDVVIEGSSGMTWTVQTDDNGYYGLFVDQTENTVAVTVAPNGYVSQSALVDVIGGDRVVQDFDLRRTEPCITAQPADLEVTLLLSHTLTTSFTILNSGALSTTFEILEVPGGYMTTTLAAVSGNHETIGNPAMASEGIDGSAIVGSPGSSSAIALTSQPFAPTSVLYDNGSLVTHPAGGAGGLDASALQTDLGMGTYGFGNQFTNGNRIADDFVIDVPWTIDSITFFAYQSFAGTPSTITGVYLQIWDGPPNDPSSSVIFGDTTTNIMVNTTFSDIYRVLDTDLTNSDRAIMANTADLGGITLLPGTYWLDWMTDGSAASGPWAPPVSVLGSTGTGNAMQYTGSWAGITDIGPQDFPFIIEGIPGGDIPWLSENPITGTVKADSTIQVELVFDATVVTQTGNYTGSLFVGSADAGGRLEIPVVMHVVSDISVYLPVIMKP